MNKTKELMIETISGLTTTAIEKICVAGKEDAQCDVTKIREMVEDLVCFWDLDERYIDQFDMDIDV